MVEQNLQFLENAGPGVPEMLIEAGFDDVKKIAAASEEELRNIKGVGAKTVVKIKALIAGEAGRTAEEIAANPELADPEAEENQPKDKKKGKKNAFEEAAEAGTPKGDEGITIGPANIPEKRKDKKPRPDGYHGPVARKNLVLKWDSSGGQIVRNVTIGEALVGAKNRPDVPASIIDEMVERNEAELI